MQCILKDFLVQGVQVTVLQAISYDGKIWRVQKIDYQVSERKVLLPIHWWTLRFRHCNRPGNCQKFVWGWEKLKVSQHFSVHIHGQMLHRCELNEMHVNKWFLVFRSICFFNLLLFSSTSCRRAAATICPRPSPPPWGPKCIARPSRCKHSSSFSRPTRSHAHRCSCPTRQHGGEQSGLVTLTFDLLTLKVVSESRVTWATSVPILVFLGVSVLDLALMYATDRRQTKALLNAPTY